MDLKQVLLNECRGKKNAKTTDELCDILDRDKEDSTAPNLRKQVRNLIMNEELPVGSCHNGYYVIEERSELESTIEDLQSRIVGMIERMQSIENAYESV